MTPLALQAAGLVKRAPRRGAHRRKRPRRPRWRGRALQIPKSPFRPHFVRASVRLHEYPDGAVAIFWGPHRIADFPPPGAEPNDLAA